MLIDSLGAWGKGFWDCTDRVDNLMDHFFPKIEFLMFAVPKILVNHRDSLAFAVARHAMPPAY